MVNGEEPQLKPPSYSHGPEQAVRGRHEWQASLFHVMLHDPPPPPPHLYGTLRIWVSRTSLGRTELSQAESSWAESSWAAGLSLSLSLSLSISSARAQAQAWPSGSGKGLW